MWRRKYKRENKCYLTPVVVGGTKKKKEIIDSFQIFNNENSEISWLKPLLSLWYFKSRTINSRIKS